MFALRCLTRWGLLLLCVACVPAASAGARESKVWVIPDRYVVAVVSGMGPTFDVTEAESATALEALRKEYHVPQAQMVYYAQGKRRGDGLLGLAGVYRDEEPMLISPQDDDEAKMLEKVVGCDITPKALWAAYDDNEVVADEDFKGKPVIFEAKAPSVSKDVMGRPYILIPVEQHGLWGVQVFFAKDDPVLRQIKKGANLVVQAFPRGKIVKNVIADGTAIIVD